MAITLSSSFSDIASAIRTAKGVSTTYTPGNMANAIISLKFPVSGVTTEPESVWTSGTDNEVLLMVEAAHAGEIDLTEYWSVGDTRSVSLSAMSEMSPLTDIHDAQTVEMVLMHANPDKYTYVTPSSSGRTKPFFIYGQKNCLTTKGMMYKTKPEEDSWPSWPRRTWCNTVYRNAIPAYLKTITKQVNVITATADRSANQTSQDYFFFPAGKEIVGGNATSVGSGTGYSALIEYQALDQWLWYVAIVLRKKIVSSDTNTWWLRSTTNAGGCVGTVKWNGTIYQTYTGSNNFGIAPHGCI